jgi:hypothetical protein
MISIFMIVYYNEIILKLISINFLYFVTCYHFVMEEINSSTDCSIIKWVIKKVYNFSINYIYLPCSESKFCLHDCYCVAVTERYLRCARKLVRYAKIDWASAWASWAKPHTIWEALIFEWVTVVNLFAVAGERVDGTIKSSVVVIKSGKAIQVFA